MKSLRRGASILSVISLALLLTACAKVEQKGSNYYGIMDYCLICIF